jgi:aspartate kinase
MSCQNLNSIIIPKAGQVFPEFNVTVDLVREQHIEAARTSVRDPDILSELEDEIDRDCDWLRSFLFAAQVCF